MINAQRKSRKVSIGIDATAIMIDKETAVPEAGLFAKTGMEEASSHTGQEQAVKRASVVVKHAPVRLADALEFPAKEKERGKGVTGLGKKAPRSLMWLSKTIHAMLRDKIAADTVNGDVPDPEAVEWAMKH